MPPVSKHVFRRFRTAHDLGQRELGILLGFEPEVAQGRVSHYESGRRSVDPDIAHRFLIVAKARGDTYTLEDVYPAPTKATA